MKQYWVEGIILPKKKKGGSEAFHQSFWANNPREAIEEALRSLPGATWLEGPRIAAKTEEQRMHDLGAPQLPGFELSPGKPAVIKRKTSKPK